MSWSEARRRPTCRSRNATLREWSSIGVPISTLKSIPSSEWKQAACDCGSPSISPDRARTTKSSLRSPGAATSPPFAASGQRGGRIDRGDAAYRLYLKGRYFWDKRSAESIAKAADYFRQAHAVDAGFTRALTGIADCHLILATFEFAEPGPPIANARAAAESALRHDAQLAEARATVGCIQALYDHRWHDADASFQLAMEIDSSYPPAWQWRGMCFCARGRLGDGLAALQAGAERDPVSLMVNTQLACGLYMARRYAEADDSCSLVLEMDPHFWPAHYFRGLTYEQQGQIRASRSRLAGGSRRIRRKLSAACRPGACARPGRGTTGCPANPPSTGARSVPVRLAVGAGPHLRRYGRRGPRARTAGRRRRPSFVAGWTLPEDRSAARPPAVGSAIQSA